MKGQFLCPKHLQQMIANPSRAERFWQDCLERGKACYRNTEYTNAIRYFGSSFDVARILVDSDHPPSTADCNHFQRLTVSGHHLSQCFGRIGCRATARHYLLATHHKLMLCYRQQPGHKGTIAPALQQSLTALEIHYQQHDDYDAIAHCLHQDKQQLETINKRIH